MMNEQSSMTFEKGEIHTTIDLRAYRLAAVKKSAYRLAKRLTVVLGSVDQDALSVAFTFPNATSEANAREAVRLFYQELLDQELREHIAEETSPMRMLILAQAFSKTDLIRHE